MCGRFTQQRPTSEIARIFEAEDLAADPGGHYNVAPTTEATVVVQREDRRAVVRYRWGLIPAWADDPKIAGRTFNARAETIATSPMFRDAFRRRRCLVPVDGFYEWLRQGSRRQPMLIGDPADQPLALAGLWTGRQDAESGEWLRTFTIVTSRPNASMTRIHDRMPVVIPPPDWTTWLDPNPRDLGELRALLEPRDEITLDARPVSLLVNNVRNDGPELIAVIEPPADLFPPPSDP
jgi:putative SOS response-associated peptidase YedK